jgi:hypothetical protein
MKVIELMLGAEQCVEGLDAIGFDQFRLEGVVVEGLSAKDQFAGIYHRVVAEFDMIDVLVFCILLSKRSNIAVIVSRDHDRYFQYRRQFEKPQERKPD